MLRGLYASAAGMASQLVMTDVVADNIANVNTPGYKQTGLRFQPFGETLIQRLGANKQVSLGGYSQGSSVLDTRFNFTQGELLETGNPLDLSIQGDGFFTIKLAGSGQLAYSRAGHFTRDAQGFLVTPDGHKVQGSSGDIVIPSDARKIDLNTSGDVFVNGNIVGRIKVSQFTDNNALERMGSNLYTSSEAAAPQPKNVQVMSGYLERANTNVVSEMVNSITALRVYESLQRSITLQNETLNKVINEVGKVQP